MTEDQFLALWEDRVTPCAGDPEGEHGAADELIVTLLRSLGWERAANKYEKGVDHDWWYA